jgi:hypothetical protein
VEGLMTRRTIALAATFVAAAVLTLNWNVPLSAWAVGTNTSRVYEPTAKPLTLAEVKKIETYMRQVFNAPHLRINAAPPDAEVYLGEHFMGIVYPDDQKEGRTFYFEMAIFAEELDEQPPARRHR